MHFDETPVEECVFWEKCLADLNVGDYAYIWRCWDDYYFVKKKEDGDYVIKEIVTLDDSTISDRMWDDFDAHDAWVSAVRNGETDRGYDDWQEDVDIWDEMDSTNYYSCSDEIVDILYDIWLWSSEYASDDWYYLNENETWTLSKTRLDILYRRIETDEEFNRDLWEDMEMRFWLNQVEFLAAEPIR